MIFVFQGFRPILDLDTRPKSSSWQPVLSQNEGFFFMDSEDNYFFLPKNLELPARLGQFCNSKWVHAWGESVLMVKDNDLVLLNRVSRETQMIKANFPIQTGRIGVLATEKTVTLFGWAKKDPYDFFLFVFDKQTHELGLKVNAENVSVYAAEEEVWVLTLGRLWLIKDLETTQLEAPGEVIDIKVHGGMTYVACREGLFAGKLGVWERIYDQRVFLLPSGTSRFQYFRTGQRIGYTDGTALGTQSWIESGRIDPVWGQETIEDVWGLENELPFSLLWEKKGAANHLSAYQKHQASGMTLASSQNHQFRFLGASSKRIWFAMVPYFETSNLNFWSTDGTAKGTHKLADTLHAKRPLVIDFVGVYEDKAYYFQGDSRGPYRLMVSDGTPNGTHILDSNVPLLPERQLPKWVADDQGFAFAAMSEDWGKEPVNVSAEEIKRWGDLSPGTENSLGQWCEVDGNLWVTMGSPKLGLELAEIIEDEPVPFDLVPGAESSFPTALYGLDGSLFVGVENESISSLWQIKEGVAYEKEAPTDFPVQPRDFFQNNHILYFSGNWKCDGRELGFIGGAPSNSIHYFNLNSCADEFDRCEPCSSSIRHLGDSGDFAWLFNDGNQDLTLLRPDFSDPWTFRLYTPGAFAVSDQGLATVMENFDEERLELNLFPSNTPEMWRPLANWPSADKNGNLIRILDGYLLFNTSGTNKHWILKDGRQDFEALVGIEGRFVEYAFSPYSEDGFAIALDDSGNTVLYSISHEGATPIHSAIENLHFLGNFGIWTYFSGETLPVGQELFRVHRESHQIELVEDIVPGPVGSYPQRLLATETSLYLVCNLPDKGFTLFQQPNSGMKARPLEVCGNQVTLSTHVPHGQWQIIQGRNGHLQEPNNPQTVFEGSANESYALVWRSEGKNGLAEEELLTVRFREPVVLPTEFNELNVCDTFIKFNVPTPSSGFAKWEVIRGLARVSFDFSSEPTVYFDPFQDGPVELLWRGVPDFCNEGEIRYVLNTQPLLESPERDRTVCGREVVLDGILKEDQVGFWTINSDGGSLSNPYDPNAVFSGLPDHVYYLTWHVDGPPCGSSEIQIKLKMGPDLKINGPSRVHPNQYIVLEAPEASAYHWFDGSTGRQNAFRFSRPVNAWVDVELENGCIQRVDHWIHFNPAHEH
ncbi:MAG: hypothetical protein H6510_02350 [Acidobacteria bacterium]|nr:hypothetical protein [Acidobacteriota bacterium]